ncbi:hypothetical protein F5B20DRAFT_476755 [Whalleya microplaca]|nr:hypothetical protein F5B20DRAFT_476755 [Whalleya microplaca]
MHLNLVLLFAFSLAAMSAPIGPCFNRFGFKCFVTNLLANENNMAFQKQKRAILSRPPLWDGGVDFEEEKAKRTSPEPPLWDGGVDFEEEKVKRSSPEPPLWDGGVDFQEEKAKRSSPGPPLWDGGVELPSSSE